MEMKVEAFIGKYRFLSNFYPAQVDWLEYTYPTVEHAYQAAKFDDAEKRYAISKLRTPGDAKKAGKKAPHSDFHNKKLIIMKILVYRKFVTHEDLGQKLLDTGDAELIEGNYWNDTFWGQCPIGNGDNHLGRILMEVREELRCLKKIISGNGNESDTISDNA